MEIYNIFFDDNDKKLIEDRLQEISKDLHNEGAKYIINLPGHRLRPLLTLKFAKDKQKMLNLACCVELLHLASLICDDVMDQAAERKGNLPVHVKYGLNHAILSVNCLFAEILKLIGSDPNLTDAEKAQIITSFGETIFIMVDGQSGEDSLENNRKKTSSLFKLACALSNETKGNFGLLFGDWYQAKDDLIDSDSSIPKEELMKIVTQAMYLNENSMGDW